MKTWKMLSAVCVAVVCGSMTMAASGSVIVYDQFTDADYAAGGLLGQTGGVGWEAAGWTGNTATIDPTTSAGLTFPGLDTAGGTASIPGADDGFSGARRGFASSYGTGTIYVGGLMNLTSLDTDSTDMFLLTTPDGDSIFFGYPSDFGGTFDADQWGLIVRTDADGGQQSQGDDGDIAVTTGTHHLVVKIEFDVSGENERVTFFVNPSAGTPDDPTAIAHQIDNRSIASSGSDAINGFGVISHFSDPGHDFDEIRVSTDYAGQFGIIPEPTTAALLGLAGLALIRRPGRRRAAHDS